MSADGGPSKWALTRWMVRRTTWGTWIAFHLGGQDRDFARWTDAVQYAHERARFAKMPHDHPTERPTL